jgi:hypothetical protein
MNSLCEQNISSTNNVTTFRSDKAFGLVDIGQGCWRGKQH